MAEGNTENGNKGLVATLGALGVIVVGLIIAIVVVSVSKNDAKIVSDAQIDEQQVEVEDAEVDETEGQYMSDINSQLNGAENVEQRITIWQSFIDVASPEDKVILYKNMSTDIVEHDPDKVWGDAAIGCMVAIDEIQQGVNSAAGVYNMASYYDRMDIGDTYVVLMNKRYALEGVDPAEIEVKDV